MTSLLKAREIIVNGSMWKVGNGEHIKTWGDKWVPHAGYNLIHNGEEYADLQDLFFVRGIIDPEAKTWGIHKVSTIFNEGERKLIMQIPLCGLNNPDSLTLPFECNGEYSVRSSYNFFLEGRTNHASSSGGPHFVHWKKVTPIWLASDLSYRADAYHYSTAMEWFSNIFVTLNSDIFDIAFPLIYAIYMD
ncbi:hypothetical protein RJT34_23921 [Clitoria ternatea]|uniref:Uncharacterized protein n=1 Tax=Clitoria ternatea TaxID=43366 RepID=A0AAN9FLW9_CLITE